MNRWSRYSWSFAAALTLWGIVVAADSNTDPTALPDRAVVRGVRYVLVDVLANDSDPDGDPLSVTITGGGEGVTQLGDGLLQFQPAACLDTARVVHYQVMTERWHRQRLPDSRCRRMRR